VKVLLDTCVWGGALAIVATAGHDVQWAGNWESDPGDEALLALAFQEGRIVVTLDKDFGELAVVHRKPHCGIVRLVDIPARQQGRYSLHAMQRFDSELAGGAIVTVTTERIRIRPAVN
jgi:predicted nuclease of predicted toxin-antitoxin system